MSADAIQVLLVEDNPADARLLEEAFRESDPAAFQVKRASRLDEAGELASGIRPDVIVLDLTLPDASGLDTVRRMRAMAPGVPIVVITGLGDEQTALEALRLGVQDYLVKGHMGSSPARALRYAVERHRMEKELLRAKEAAEAASRAKDDFLAVLSHELRTPLTPILAVVTELEAQPSLPNDLRGDLDMIRRNVELEARLIDDLLDLTRIARRKIELRHEVVDAHELLRGAMAAFRKEIDAKALTVTVALNAERHHVWADAARLQQVFTNLLSNAVKFTPANGRITVASSNTGEDRLIVRVVDSGIGIEPDVLPRLFNSFEQGERSVGRRFGGLGLGLSIARSLVEMHGGKIAALSAGRDQGTILSVDLETVRYQEALPAGNAPVALRAGEKQYRILLVEDHADTRRVMTRLLQSIGCSVTAAGSVREAMDSAAREMFDLLVSDIGLPDGSGIDVMRRINALYRIKGIAVSGFGQDEDRRRSREAGFETHLTKPVDFGTLQSVIGQLAG